MRIAKILIWLIPVFFVAACGAGDDAYVQPTGAEMANLEKVVGAVDWSKAEQRKVVLDEFEFRPANLVFKKDQPYELTLTNEGGVAHSFVAPAFFDAIAVQGLIFADGEVKMPVLKSLAFQPGETKTLVFVPLKAGGYPLVCTQPLHETFGMTGTIRIE
jgi:uncharacterized cupredoxin-like copper-binding protein